MDFLKLLRSFEELLFEIVSWLVFAPRTLWLVLRHPARMVAYARHEVSDEGDDRYPATVSPPLLLLLVILVAHGLELGSGREIVPDSPMAQVLFGSDQNLILTRSLFYGLLPLMAAVRYVTAKGLPLDRAHLRGPFVGQCYLAAILVLAIAATSALARLAAPWAPWGAAAVMLSAIAWYLAAQGRVYRDGLGVSVGRALVLAAQAFLGAWLYLAVLVLVLVLTL